MRHTLFTLFVVLMLPIQNFAQNRHWIFYRHALHFGLGTSNFLGELGGANQIGTNGIKDLELSLTRYSITAGYRYKLTPNIGLRTSLIHALLRGDDAKTEEIHRKNRNLHFKSPIVQLVGLFEWYPFGDKTSRFARLKGIRNQNLNNYNLYLFSGIGGFWFNPKAQAASDGKWHTLQPLGTEGQRVAGSGVHSYKRIQFSIPMGIGIKYNLDHQLSIGLEIWGHKTFTDYIDDVSNVYHNKAELSAVGGPVTEELSDPSLGLEGSGWTPSGIIPGQQRGDPSDKDSYIFAIFTINYKLLQGRLHLPKF